MQFDWIYLPQYFFNWLTDLQAQAGNIGFDWAFIPQHFFDAPLLQGAAMTIFISVVAQFFGIILGLIAALMKNLGLRRQKHLAVGVHQHRNRVQEI